MTINQGQHCYFWKKSKKCQFFFGEVDVNELRLQDSTWGTNSTMKKYSLIVLFENCCIYFHVHIATAFIVEQTIFKAIILIKDGNYRNDKIFGIDHLTCWSSYHFINPIHFGLFDSRFPLERHFVQNRDGHPVDGDQPVGDRSRLYSCCSPVDHCEDKNINTYNRLCDYIHRWVNKIRKICRDNI